MEVLRQRTRQTVPLPPVHLVPAAICATRGKSVALAFERLPMTGKSSPGTFVTIVMGTKESPVPVGSTLLRRKICRSFSTSIRGLVYVEIYTTYLTEVRSTSILVYLMEYHSDSSVRSGSRNSGLQSETTCEQRSLSVSGKFGLTAMLLAISATTSRSPLSAVFPQTPVFPRAIFLSLMTDVSCSNGLQQRCISTSDIFIKYWKSTHFRPLPSLGVEVSIPNPIPETPLAPAKISEENQSMCSQKKEVGTDQ